MRWRIVSTVYEHQRATFGVKGPQGKSLAVDVDALEPLPANTELEQGMTLILSPRAAAGLKRLRKDGPLQGRAILIGSKGDIVGAEAP